jgi:hypothetical protein
MDEQQQSVRSHTKTGRHSYSKNAGQFTELKYPYFGVASIQSPQVPDANGDKKANIILRKIDATGTTRYNFTCCNLLKYTCDNNSTTKNTSGITTIDTASPLL